jgi:hypothetical protein
VLSIRVKGNRDPMLADLFQRHMAGQSVCNSVCKGDIRRVCALLTSQAPHALQRS